MPELHGNIQHKSVMHNEVNMEQYVVEGGNPLVGEVEIGGAKNAALAILAASVMTDETVLIENMPDVRDTNILLQAMQSIGVIVERVDRHTVKVNASHIHELVIEDDFIKKIRASYYLLGALLGKYNKAEVALPGGCNIGSRPIDQHIKGFKALGADVRIEHGLIITEAPNLKGSHVYMDVVSVGATINVMMAAAMADGMTIIENAAKEPHVVDLANFLNSMGANIKGAGTDVIRIRGVQKLHKTEYAIIPDQIEAGTFMFAAAATQGDVTVKNVIPKHLESISAKLMEIGCEVEESDDAVRVVASRPLNHTHVKTLPYPGFPTDMQPQITVALGLSQGTSIVTESIFENRFKYVDELTRMGASIKVEGNSAIIDGVTRYTGASITAPDLRAGAALVIAALAAEGVSTVDDILYIERGYENFPEKLRGIGAQIEKVDNERDIKKFRFKVV
jgi:UDP-N-acetylglucosamine 1-carboxyvinyltransferase|nr:UDP-N-acetylglucosamine 1-carboxyvinyltransferase [Eisenbergiella sp. OF01-20]